MPLPLLPDAPVRTRPRLSTIRLRSAEGVTEAVRLVTTAAGETVPEERIVLPGELCLRETTWAATAPPSSSR